MREERDKDINDEKDLSYQLTSLTGLTAGTIATKTTTAAFCPNLIKIRSFDPLPIDHY